MKKMTHLLLALGLCISASEASAISFTTHGGPSSQVAGVNYVVDFESGAPTTGFARYETVVPAASGQAFEIWGVSQPKHLGMMNNTNYLAVGGSNAFVEGSDGTWDAPDAVLQITLGGLTDYFGFEWGTMDWYNDLYFYNGDRLVGLFTGNAQVVPGVHARIPHGTIFVSNTPHASSQLYVNFFSDGVDDLFDRILMVSGQAFESDNHSFRIPQPAEVPEPASMVLLGMGALGALGVRRKQARA